MGFLSKFSGTERVDLGDGFYVEVRRFLSSAQQDAAETMLIQPRMQIVPDGKGKVKQEMIAAMDYAGYNREIAAQAIVSWNLTDEADAALPHTPIEALRVSLQRIPASVIHQVVKVIDDREGEGPETAAFPGSGEEGAADRT